MRFVAFYEEYLSAVIMPRMAEVAAKTQPVSLADFRRCFNRYFGLSISYDQFRAWTRDLGITVMKSAAIEIPRPTEMEAEPPPVTSSPQSGGQAEYNFQQNRPAPEQSQRDPGMMVGRGGISLPDMFKPRQ